MKFLLRSYFSLEARHVLQKTEGFHYSGGRMFLLLDAMACCCGKIFAVSRCTERWRKQLAAKRTA